MKGKIITVEGLDGSGKSTQIKLLKEKLESLGIAHQFIHFPMLNKGIYGTLVAEFLRGEYGSLETVHPKLVALLFAEDRKEHKQKLLTWLEQGYIIILDRYVKSNVAFQCAKVENDIQKSRLKEWILDFEFHHNALPKPEVSFFLDLPIELIAASLKTIRSGKDRSYLKGQEDIHETSLDFQKKVLAEYRLLLQESPHFYSIACSSSYKKWLAPMTIHERLFSKIEPHL